MYHNDNYKTMYHNANYKKMYHNETTRQCIIMITTRQCMIMITTRQCIIMITTRQCIIMITTRQCIIMITTRQCIIMITTRLERMNRSSTFKAHRSAERRHSWRRSFRTSELEKVSKSCAHRIRDKLCFKLMINCMSRLCIIDLQTIFYGHRMNVVLLTYRNSRKSY